MARSRREEEISPCRGRRSRCPIGRWNRTPDRAHGFVSAFPDKAGFIQPSANSFALLAGIGVDYKYRRHLSFRLIQADYGYTRRPNLAGNDPNLLRISSGITIHLK